MNINYQFDKAIVSQESAKKAVQEPVVIQVKDFTPESAAAFEASFCSALQTGQDVVPIVIDSYGGQVYALMSMIDVIKASPVPVATVVMGKAMSCGAFLFAMGSQGHRYMAPNATLMIHEVSSAAWGKVADMAVDTDQANYLNDRAFELLDESCGKKKGYFKKLVHDTSHADIYWTAKQSKKHGICNHIKIPGWKVSFEVTRKFA